MSIAEEAGGAKSNALHHSGTSNRNLPIATGHIPVFPDLTFFDDGDIVVKRTGGADVRWNGQQDITRLILPGMGRQ